MTETMGDRPPNYSMRGPEHPALRCIAAQSFFSEIYTEAVRAVPGPGHWAIASMAKARRLRRHYTLNIDGLSEAAGLSTWHPVSQPTGESSSPLLSVMPFCCQHNQADSYIEGSQHTAGCHWCC